MKKLFPSLIFTLFLMQGCVVYQKTPVSIDNAVSKGPVKVIDIEYDVWNFMNIVYIDSTYYGILEGKTYQKIKLDPESLMSIQMIDPKNTKSANSIVILAASAALVIGVYFLLRLIYGY